MSKIRDYINKVKAKSEAEKKRVVFMWTLIIISLIFLIWVISFSLSVANNEADLARLQVEAEATAKAQLAKDATNTSPIGVNEANVSLVGRLSQFVSGGASAVSEGFWTVGSWLHQ